MKVTDCKMFVQDEFGELPDYDADVKKLKSQKTANTRLGMPLLF